MKQYAESLPLVELLPEVSKVISSIKPSLDHINSLQLFNDRKIYLDRDVDADVLGIQRSILLWNTQDQGLPMTERKPIRLYIMSYGGDVNYMWSLIDAIRLSETPVYTYNIGMAASAASLIFMAGHKRWMTPRAKVIIHEGAASMHGDAGKVLDATDSYRKLLGCMRDFIIDRTQIPPTLLSRKKNNDWEIDADECLKLGITDEIVSGMSSMV